MKKKIYETPRTLFYSVEVEGSFASSASLKDPDNEQAYIEEHDVNLEYNSFDKNVFSSDGAWD